MRTKPQGIWTFFAALAPALALRGGEPGAPLEPERGIVVSASDLASRAGLDALRRGGNAVDAAVATAFVLAVTWPEAGNIGGGGYLLLFPGGVRDGAGPAEPEVFDFRETAPAAARREMFVEPKDRTAHRRVGVPGTVRGLALAHRLRGRRPWKELLAPAVRLAGEGFPLESDLAVSLGRIAEEGPDAFYDGEIAERIVSEMGRGGGLITRDDLAAYRPVVRKAVHGTYRGHDIYGVPPSSSGGICLVEMLNLLENFDLEKQGRWSPRTLHLIIEAMRRAYCDRARHLGDPGFASIPDHLTGKEYARELAKGIDIDRATPSPELAKDLPLGEEPEHTTHLSVIDRDRMAVSLTYTLESSYGSRVVVRGGGFLLNDEMNDFNWLPGVTSRSGRIGTEPNQAAPGKRMLSSQAPTVVAKEGKPVLITGSPGGRTIINTVLCVVINVVDFGMSPQAAVDAPRLHQQWLPDQVRIEPGLLSDHPQAVKELRAMGHTLVPSGRQGDAHSIGIDPRTGAYVGAKDRRISGPPAGR